MVEKMRSPESKVSRVKNNNLASDLRLPVFEQPTIEPWPLKMSWDDAMRSFTPLREYFMRHFDSPEKRARDKNSKPFSLL